jgi:hypothetical protein
MIKDFWHRYDLGGLLFVAFILFILLRACRIL